MKWVEATVLFDHSDPEMAADLIAGVFYDLSLTGVVVEGALPEPADGWADDLSPSQPEDAVRGYFPKDDRLAERLETLRARVTELAQRMGMNWRLQMTETDEENWAEAWKAYFHPVRVGERIVVKPTWRTYEAAPEDLVIEIDPGMAFGTGTHPTTSLCIRMLERHLRPDGRFLDVGTGSGILMVAAYRLGAATLHGVDSDPLAVEVARNNLRLNAVPESAWRVDQGDLTQRVHGRFEVIAANILTDVVLRLLPQACTLLAEGGRVVLSGIISENRKRVVSEMAARGLTVLNVAEAEGWIAAVGEKGL